MTTLAAPARTPASGALTPVRLQLRLHRPALTCWTLLVLALSALLLLLGGPLTDDAAAAWAQFNACQGEHCIYDQGAIILYKNLYTYLGFAVLAVPVLVAAWAGASLTGRELENGTAKLAWTQGISPARWLAAKLAVPAVAVAAGTGLLVLFHRMAWSAGRGRVDSVGPWYDSSNFYANGPVLVALALAGLAVGALAGLLWGRSLAALGTAMVAMVPVWTGLQYAVPHLWPSVTRESGLQQGVTGQGLTSSEGFVTPTGDRHGLLDECGAAYLGGCRTAYDKVDAVGFYHDYHPGTHYLPLQLTATALVLAVTAALAVAAFRILRRRTGATPAR